VFPFAVSSTENIDYIQQGVWGMLASRISADNKVEVTSSDIVLGHLKKLAKKELTLTDIRNLGTKMKSDFVVWGNITKKGNNVSIEGKLIEVSTEQTSVALSVQTQGLDEIIPNIDDFAQRISKRITGELPLDLSTAAAAPGPVPEPSSLQAEREKKIISGMKASKTGTFTSLPLSPDLLDKPAAAPPKKP
jgi:TolB-like protein